MLSCILSKRGDFLSGRGYTNCRKEKDENESGVNSVSWPESPVANAILVFCFAQFAFWPSPTLALLQYWPSSKYWHPPMLAFANHA
jgi:hypothetical protein